MPIRDLLLGVLVTFIWAANFVVVRFGLDAGLPPLLLTALRFLAVAVLIPAVPRPGRDPPLPPLAPRRRARGSRQELRGPHADLGPSLWHLLHARPLAE